MRGPSTEPSAFLALMLAMLILLVVRWGPSTAPLPVALVGALVGSGLTLVVLRVHDQRASSRRDVRMARRFEEMRDEIAGELNAMSGELRRNPSPDPLVSPGESVPPDLGRLAYRWRRVRSTSSPWSVPSIRMRDKEDPGTRSAA